MANLLSTTVNGSLLALNNGVTNAYSTASNGRLYFGYGGDNNYSIYTHMEAFNGNYTKLTLDWHTGIKIGASQGYGGIRFYNDAINNGGVKLFSIGEGDAHVRVENNLYVGNTIFNNGNAVIHAGNIGSQSVSYATSAGTLANNAAISGLNFSGVLALAGSGASTGNSTGARLSESYGPYWNLGDSATWHYQIVNGSLLVGISAGGTNYGSGNIRASGSIYADTDKLVIHSGNIGSQTVATAGALSSMNISQFSNNSGYITSSASITGNAASATYARRITDPERIGFNVGGESNRFYPVVIYTGAASTSQQYSEFIIERGGYEDPGYTGIGFSTFNARFTYKPNGWGYGAQYFNLEQLSQTATMLGDYLDQYQSSQAIIWLRGATRYNIYSVYGGITLLFANESGTSYTMAYGTYDPISTPTTKATTTKYYEGSVRHTGSIFSGDSVQAPIFYDSDNTGYYLDPNGNSILTTATFNVNASSTIAITSAGTNASMIKAGAGDELYIGGNNTWQMRFNSGNVLMDNGGYLQNDQSLRAPIFYDSNDTGYYLDPNSNSKLVNLGLGGATPDARLSVSGDIHMDGYIYQGGTAGVINSWGSRTVVNSGNYVSNARSFAFNNVGYGSNWTFAIAADGAVTTSRHIDASTTWTNSATTLFLGWYGGKVVLGNNNNGMHDQAAGLGGNTVISTNPIYAPIYYDLENTTYYGDFASTSYLRHLSVGDVNASNDGGWNARLNLTGSSHARLDVKSNSDGIITTMYSHAGQGVGRVGTMSNHPLVFMVNGNVAGYAYANYLQGVDSVRAPIFYDSADTTYYCDPNGYSNLYGVAIRGDVASRAGGNQIFFWGGGNTTTSAIGFKAVGGEWNEHGYTSAGYNTYFTMDSANRGWVFRRATVGGSDWTGVNVASISNTGNAQFDGLVNTPTGYVSNGNPWGTANSAFFPNGITTAGGTNWIYGFTFIGNAPGNGAGTHFTTDGHQYSTGSIATPSFLVNNHSDNTKGYRIHTTSGVAVSAMFTNSANALVIGAGAFDQVQLNKKVLVSGAALGVNVAASATAGRIDASNDIVAYSSSDERLKQNITPIENALDKVKSLTGVEFDWKPEYKHAHGYEGHDTGIIAQQVQDVMPSAVRTNDTGFLAVRYEKLIGLLIEGMKEQQAQIDELKAKLDGLTK